MSKLVTIFEQRFPEPTAEAFVMSCGHSESDQTIYICNNPKHWKKLGKKHDWVDIMTSILSHESLHFAITKVCDDMASLLLDNRFGTGTQYRQEYHGLCKFHYVFYRHWNRVK